MAKMYPCGNAPNLAISDYNSKAIRVTAIYDFGTVISKFRFNVL